MSLARRKPLLLCIRVQQQCRYPTSLLCSPITVLKSTDVISSFYIHYFKPQTTASKQTSLCLLLNSKKLIKQGFFHDEAHYIGRL